MASISEDIPQQRQREVYPSLMPKSAFPPPSKGFRPSVATKQNRMSYLHSLSASSIRINPVV